jgi:hypothetical protein
LFRKSFLFGESVEKDGTARQATDYIIMLGIKIFDFLDGYLR